MRRSGQAATAAVLVAAVAVGAWWWRGDTTVPASVPVVAVTAQPIATPLTASTLAAAANADGPMPPEAQHEALRRWIRNNSSLRGTQPDGDWGALDVQGRLRPSATLRLRFDQLLTLQGELTLDQIGLFVAHNASETLGPAGGAQVVDVWRRYLDLQGRALSARVSLNDPSTWRHTQNERVAARRATLGAEWAAAFYAQDDRAFDAMLQRAESQPPPAAESFSLLNAAELTPEQAQRLSAQRLAWSDWQARLALTQDEWSRLQGDPTLSGLQRQNALDAFMGSRFDAAEQRRVRALLGIQP